MLHPWTEQRCLALYCSETRHTESNGDNAWMDRWMEARMWVWNHIERGSNDGIGGPETNPAGELLEQARDGTRGAGSWGFKANRRAVGCQEDFPHRLQTGLTLRGEGTPGEEKGWRERNQKGARQGDRKEKGYGEEILLRKHCKNTKKQKGRRTKSAGE